MTKKLLWGIVTVLLVTLVIAPVAAAEEKTGQTADEATEYISLSVKEMKLSDVLTLIARRTGVNVVIDRGADTMISLDLKDVYFEKAFEIIEKAYGRSFRKLGSTYIFGIPSDIQANFDRALHTTLRLQFGSAGRIKAVLEDVFGAHDDFKACSSRLTNTISLSGPLDVIEAASELIATLDVPVHRIRIEAELIKMKGESGQEPEKAELIAYSDGIVQNGLPLLLEQRNYIPKGPATEEGQQAYKTGFRLTLMPSANDDGYITLARISGSFSLLVLSEDIGIVPELKRVFDSQTYCKAGTAVEIGRFYDYQSKATFIVRITPHLVRD